MRVCGQQFTPDIVRRIEATVEAEPWVSRRGLSRRVCEWLEWRAPNGKLREVSCRKALLELNRRGQVKLPEAERVRGFEVGQAEPKDPPQVPEVRSSLSELGEVEVRAVPVAADGWPEGQPAALGRVFEGQFTEAVGFGPEGEALLVAAAEPFTPEPTRLFVIGLPAGERVELDWAPPPDTWRVGWVAAGGEEEER